MNAPTAPAAQPQQPVPLHTPDALLDGSALQRLRWRCRRGLLENDLLLQRFFERSGGQLSQRQAHALERLMDLPDPDLLDLLLARRSAADVLGATAALSGMAELLDRLRSPYAAALGAIERLPSAT